MPLLFGAFRVVNGALEYLAKDLGIVENTVLQGTRKCYYRIYHFFQSSFILTQKKKSKLIKQKLPRLKLTVTDSSVRPWPNLMKH